MRLMFDVTRTLARRYNATPTGIDRVELEFLRSFISTSPKNSVSFVVTTKYGNAVLAPSTMKQIFHEVTERWGSASAHRRSHVSLLGLRGRRGVELLNELRALSFIVSLVIKDRFTSDFKKLCLRARSSVFLSTSHVGLEDAKSFLWLDRHNVRGVFFIHDTIPLDFPEFCKPNAAAIHRRRLETVSRFGDRILTCSEYSKSRLLDHLGKDHKIHVATLGNKITLPTHTQPSNRRLHFVCLGTIEGRKNLSFLLEIWRSIVQRYGASSPKLIILGKRGWNAEAVCRVLDESAQLRLFVEQKDGLSDAEVYEVLANARGFLAPSLVEGYGLTPTEALQIGIPVIASDIPAHREVLGSCATFIDPIDGTSWREAIMSLHKNEDHHSRTAAEAKRFTPTTWNSFVESCLSHIEVATR
ncbi:glycosyltransferase family 4 protein [Agrobacterium larrymoorei]|uniref:Glycosyltransferase involved in cell wall biosynthesis n=1 Tax=Agrobacterium larrymoorei TaxID=160699 RepID=A0ABU0UI66_9HYPH|nr:glycosyltransferase family 1 protein [Agrobacterium larrymoorei]MDQ1184629.1 glycosyltransferase involved in cell wall biosynthesis [Agrobacterium larrymoorei]